MVTLSTQGGTPIKLLNHAANALAMHIDGDIFRIIYSARDELNRFSAVVAVYVDIKKRCVVRAYEKIFFHGSTGNVYAEGRSIGNSYASNRENFIMFMGW